MVRAITLPQPGQAQLQVEARAEGHEFIDQLIGDWTSAEQRFDGPGELLAGAFVDGELVAVGGLTRDPFVAQEKTGRIRKVYVRAAYRKAGIGTSLLNYLIEKAGECFDIVRLQAASEEASRLYERLGFAPISEAKASHKLILKSTKRVSANAQKQTNRGLHV